MEEQRFLPRSLDDVIEQATPALTFVAWVFALFSVVGGWEWRGQDEAHHLAFYAIPLFTTAIWALAIERAMRRRLKAANGALTREKILALTNFEFNHGRLQRYAIGVSLAGLLFAFSGGGWQPVWMAWVFGLLLLMCWAEFILFVVVAGLVLGLLGGLAYFAFTTVPGAILAAGLIVALAVVASRRKG